VLGRCCSYLCSNLHLSLLVSIKSSLVIAPVHYVLQQTKSFRTTFSLIRSLIVFRPCAVSVA